MAYRRSRAEIIAPACVPALLEKPSKLYDRITYRHPVGPRTVSVLEPKDRKIIGRRYVRVDEFPMLQTWLRQLHLQFNSVQWFVASGKGAKQRPRPKMMRANGEVR